MVHNGIEYGLMAAYAEGLAILKAANVGKQNRRGRCRNHAAAEPEHYQYDLNLPDIAEVWRRGSVIASWLLDLSAAALLQDPGSGEFAGRVSDSGEGRWTIKAAIDEGVPAHVLSSALYERFSSRGEADFADKLLSAMRYEFGGHVEKPAAAIDDSGAIRCGERELKRHDRATISINWRSTRSAHSRSMRCSRPNPAIPARRWRWRRWSIRSGTGSCGSIPQDPIWPNRDRFVLSNGHASMLLWSVLHLTGTQAVNADYERLGKPSVTLDDIRHFRQLGSKAPGHPEYHWVSGVEATTGPLGQGIATSVGMAIARKWLAQPLQPAGLRAVRLQHLCGLRRRLHDGRRRLGGGVARRPSRPRQPVLDLRQQPHHHRRQHAHHVHRGRRGAFSRLRGMCCGWATPTTSEHRACARGVPADQGPANTDHPGQSHRLWLTA